MIELITIYSITLCQSRHYKSCVLVTINIVECGFDKKVNNFT